MGSKLGKKMQHFMSQKLIMEEQLKIKNLTDSTTHSVNITHFLSWPLQHPTAAQSRNRVNGLLDTIGLLCKSDLDSTTI